MYTPHRVQRMAIAAVLGCGALCLLLAPVASPQAAPLRWTGAGATALWSDAANWDALRLPANGDELLFAGAPARAQSVLDLNRSFVSLVFAADAQAFSLHAHGSGAVLGFDASGPGIRNLTGGSGPIRQDLYADAGSAGGSIVFSGTSGINLGNEPTFRPVNLTALGAATATALGGRIVFQDDASTSASTFDALRAEGASAAGGGTGGGNILFSGRALTTLTVTGGSVLGAAGGQASFSELARAESIVNVLPGQGGGQGGRVDFSGQATASVFASFNNRGAVSAGAGAQGITSFRGSSLLAGSVNNEAGTIAGSLGGQLEFRGRASQDTSGIDPTLGIVQILNGGSTATGAGSGSTVFRDDSSIRGTQLVIVNGVQGEGAAVGSIGGSTEFRDRASAGRATIVNAGAESSGAGAGTLHFADNSSAGGATIDNAAGRVAGTVGGSTRFSGHAGAGTATLTNNASLGAGGGSGGFTVLSDDASAQNARIDNQGGFFTTDNAATRFRDRASAGQALITNLGGRAAGAFGGSTTFEGSASAGTATLVMTGGGTNAALGGSAVFFADANAGSATLDVRAAGVSGAVGGRALFFDRASAGTSSISVGGSPLDHVLGAEGGVVTFAGSSSAADAAFTVGGNAFAGGGVGTVRFTGSSTAARATVTLAAGQTRGGVLSFDGASPSDLASAGSAHITNQGSSAGAARGLAIGGQTTFVANATAGSATLTNQAGAAFGLTSFFASSGAGTAHLNNLGGAGGEDGGTTQFNNTSSAQSAVIVNAAGARGSNGFDAAGTTRFVDQASAGQARITAAGAASAGAIGGLISFGGAAQPAGATLIAEGGSNGGTGGRILFSGLTNASQVRVILNAGAGAGGGAGSGGQLDISAMSTPRVAVGSIEGGGIVNLGGRDLTLWSRGADTVFSGLLRDGGFNGGSGGSLTITGGATLTLTGANAYTGGTRIGDGVNADSGKLVAANSNGSATGSGAVVVNRGGTLGGSGFIDGPVSLMDGGVIAPGDPVTLTFADSLTWNGGGVIRLALGADTAGSDQVVMRSLIRGTDGDFVFELIDFGVVAGESYELLDFDSVAGFDVGDFSVSGLEGSLALRDGRLEFTVLAAAAVAEPGAVMLCLLGLLVVGATRRRSLQGPSPNRSPARVGGSTPRCR